MRFWVLCGMVVVVSCSSPQVVLKTGGWRGVIEIQGHELPFNFDLTRDSAGYKIFIHNGTERLMLDEVSVAGDSLRAVLHIFDAELRARISDGKLTGYYVRNFEKNYRLPFQAAWHVDYRFANADASPGNDFSGTYSVRFFFDKDTANSVGVFRQNGSHVEGTFLNIDGDYRYLEGNIVGGKMWLSTFDGHHLYLFSASRESDGQLRGDYWSGKAHHETWTGVLNPNAALPDAGSFTFLKKGYDKLDFHFPGLDGKKISPGDDRFRNKVLILQMFGTWCPNCLDETKFLARWYEKNKDRGVEILGLAYERKDDFEYAVSRITKMKSKLHVSYDFAVAGTSDKESASATLPALNKVIAFPTTIFIGKDGKVKHIDTGFTGPGTGVYYEEFVQRFNETVNELLGSDSASSSR